MKNEKVLISRVVLLGDREAFGRLVDAYQSPVRRFFLNMAPGDEELAKDLAQETFIKAWLKIGSFRSMSRFSTWLFRIAYNTFYDYRRTLKDSTDIDDVVSRMAVSSKDADLAMDISSALEILKVDERAAMILFYMEDQPVKKIAAIMGCPEGTVKSLLSRGRAKLSDLLRDSHYNK